MYESLSISVEDLKQGNRKTKSAPQKIDF